MDQGMESAIVGTHFPLFMPQVPRNCLVQSSDSCDNIWAYYMDLVTVNVME